ncbi:C-C chemokine receptor type 3-like [Stegostoma tigrinum]|uniref:C-C chemokine receptor type 3-like n=1 Tax=Stegostoma tigrinum TaxID=3053191 RepID=UPI00202B889F|nr:C-C chemokine receptor type 3-like [Stegostoma tigrinum]XP_059497225.1 C-C chemokine receptor type 3-like [Stegostoma tigrinum]
MMLNTTEMPTGDYELLCEKDNVNSFGAALMPSFYMIVLILSLIGNGLVLLVLVKYEYLKSITNIFILNLAISDLLSAICLPFWVVHHLKGWIFGVVMCKLMSGMFYIGFYSGIMFLTLMTIDRYLAVVHAVSAARSRKIRYATVTSVIVWLTSTLATVPDFIFVDLDEDYKMEICDNIYPYDAAVPWKLFRYYQQNIVFFVLPFIIIVYCYFRIIQTLVKCRTVQKHRTLRVIFTIVVVFFLCWAPYNVVIFLRSLEEIQLLQLESCDLEMQLDYAHIISYTVAYFHCCLNPIFYAFVGEKFRRHLIHFWDHYLPCGLLFHQRQYATRNVHMEYSDGSNGNDTTNNW